MFDGICAMGRAKEPKQGNQADASKICGLCLIQGAIVLAIKNSLIAKASIRWEAPTACSDFQQK